MEDSNNGRLETLDVRSVLTYNKNTETRLSGLKPDRKAGSVWYYPLALVRADNAVVK